MFSPPCRYTPSGRQRISILISTMLLAATLTTLHADAATTTTYYVDCAGSDRADGTSPDTAWATVRPTRKANLAPGDSLLLKRGCVWDEGDRLMATWSGTASAPITIGAYGEGDRPTLMNGRIDTVHITGSHLIVQDLAVDNTPDEFSSCARPYGGNTRTPVGTYYGINLTEGAHHVVVQRSIVQHSTVGLHLAKTAGGFNKIIDNEFVDNDVMQTPFGVDLGAWGMLVRSHDNEIAHNYFSNNVARCGDGVNPFIDSNSIEIYEGSRNTIHHNVAKNDRVFSEMGSSSSIKARDNYYGYNVVVSNIAGARFVTTRGADDTRFGPVLGTSVEHNTVIYTGSESEAFVCAKACRASVMSVHNNTFQTAGKAYFVNGSIDMSNNILSTSDGESSVTIQDDDGRRVVDEGTSTPQFFVADVQFAGDDPWMLAPDSPAIDAAHGTARYDYDIARLPIVGSSRDIGAFEFRPSSPPTTSTTTPTTTTTTTTTTAPPSDPPTNPVAPTTTAAPAPETTTTVPAATTTVPAATTTVPATTTTVAAKKERTSVVPTIVETNVDGSTVMIRWTGGQENTMFRVRYRTGRDKWSEPIQTSDHEIELTGLDTGRRYRIQVGARINGKWPARWDNVTVKT